MPAQTFISDPFLGLQLSHYRILEKIGSGGMGVVYRAHDEHLDREVAIKVLRPGALADESSRRRFHTEALALSKLNHSNIATIYDFDTQQGVDFLVMEYIPGITLSNKLAHGPLAQKNVLQLGLQLAAGLAAAHEHGVEHRDLKPGNLRLTTDERLKILDFGLARLRQPVAESVATASTLESRAMTGTLAYMAPEQLYGEEADARADIHAAGLVLYEMATGQRPFGEVESSQVIGAILRRPPIPPSSLNPGVSLELERIIAKCLEKEPENRYQSAKELAVDLRRLAMPSATTSSAIASAAPRSWRRKAATPAGLFVVAFIIVASELATRSRSTAALDGHETIVLADFENLTGETLFDRTVTEAMRQAIAQSRYVRLMPQAQVLEASERMGRKNFSRLDASLGREICRRENCSAVLTGRIVPAGNKYSLTVQLLDPREGTQVLSDAATLHSPAELYNAADELARSLREQLGETLALVNQNSQPLAKVTTPSLEALQRYSRAMDFYAAADFENFLPLAKSAVEIDPNFAMAHLYLARAMGWLGDEDGARGQMAQARQNMSRVTERERHMILATDFEFNGQYEKAAEQYRLLTEVFPNDLEGYRSLAEASFWAGRAEEGLASMQKALALNPHSADDQQRLILQLVRLNRFSEALARYQEARKQGSRRPMLHWGGGLAYLGQGDSQSARQEFELLGKEAGPYEASLSTLYLTRVLMYEGRLREATDSLSAGLVLGEKLHSETWIPVQRYLRARVLCARGHISEARVEVRQMALAANVPALEQELRRSGLMAVQLGDLSTARKLLARLEELATQRDSGYTKSCYYNLKGAVELASGDAESAIESQQRAALFFPSYQAQAGLAKAYGARQEWRSAAAANRHYLEFKGEIFNEDSPEEWVVAHLALGRALAKAGETKQALESYDEFLRLWAHGDPDLTAVREARAERERLSRTIARETTATKDIPRDR